MKTSDICKLDSDIFRYIKFLFFMIGALLAHGSLRCPCDGGDDESDKQKIKHIVDLIENYLKACPAQVAVLDMAVLNYLLQNFLEREHFTVIAFLPDASTHLLTLDFLIPKIFLLDELDLFEGAHLEQLHEGLRSEFCLIPEHFVDAVYGYEPQRHR